MTFQIHAILLTVQPLKRAEIGCLRGQTALLSQKLPITTCEVREEAQVSTLEGMQLAGGWVP